MDLKAVSAARFARKTVDVEGLGGIDIQALSAKGFSAFAEAQREGTDNISAALILIQHGVPEWSSHTVEELGESLDPELVMLLSTEIAEISGMGDDSKNSESDPSSDSSTDSP
jgi:hypothetical protein